VGSTDARTVRKAPKTTCRAQPTPRWSLPASPAVDAWRVSGPRCRPRKTALRSSDPRHPPNPPPQSNAAKNYRSTPNARDIPEDFFSSLLERFPLRWIGGDSRIGLVLIHAFCRRGGWCAWPDPFPLTFVDVSLTRLRADCRVERRLSDLASVGRARSGGGPWSGAMAM
jgi:hypothetical protein